MIPLIYEGEPDIPPDMTIREWQALRPRPLKLIVRVLRWLNDATREQEPSPPSCASITYYPKRRRRG